MFFGATAAPVAVASAVGLAYAPQVLAFLELAPFIGVLIQVVLSLWSMLAVILAVRVGLGLETWEAVVIAAGGWLLLQALASPSAGHSCNGNTGLRRKPPGCAWRMSPRICRLRRHNRPTRYLQSERWGNDPHTMPLPNGPVDGEVAHVHRPS
ncbi:MAG: hypothetical protein IPK16_06790 [Anaerolineales bacterium]|nr:hypothetical protein [Anaerolineales bacterium]